MQNCTAEFRVQPLLAQSETDIVVYAIPILLLDEKSCFLRGLAVYTLLTCLDMR